MARKDTSPTPRSWLGSPSIAPSVAAERLHLQAPLDEWRAARQQIHDDVCLHVFDPQLDSFVQFYGSKQMDASLLFIPLVGFLPASDPRVAGTIRQIERQLIRDGFVLRYETHRFDDGLPAR